MTGLYGAVEAGGTKFVCAVGTGPDDLRAEARIDTTTPAQTLGRVIDFFRAAVAEHGALRALGVGTFGPVDLDRDSPTYGSITTTPKPSWAHTPVVAPLAAALGVPVGFDTDVNAAVLGEARWGAGVGRHSLLYLTVGTGIGGGALADGRLVHGRLHPEMGHIRVPHDRQRDPYEGWCPFHGDCLEGLAAGPAMRQRWGVPADELPPEHEAWDLQAHYLAHAVTTLTLTLSPQRVILGGGVMSQQHLFPKIRRETARLLAGYLQVPELAGDLADYVVAPGLGTRAGICGALALAHSAGDTDAAGAGADGG